MLIDTTIVLILLNLISLTLFAIILLFLYKKLYKSENDDTHDAISAIFTNFLTQIDQVVDQKIQKLDLVSFLEQKQVKENLIHSIITSFYTMIADEELSKDFGLFIRNQVTEVFNEALPELISNLGEIALPNMFKDLGLPTLTKEELEQEQGKAEKAAGAIIVNSMDQMLPPVATALLENVMPNWKTQAQEKPQTFILMLQYLKKYGIFDMIGNVTNKNAVEQRVQTGF